MDRQPSRKRPNPYLDDATEMRSSPSKMAKLSPEAPHLSDAELLVLEQAARILRRPIAQLVGSENGSESTSWTPDISGAPSFPLTDATSTAGVSYPGGWSIDDSNPSTAAFNHTMTGSLQDVVPYNADVPSERFHDTSYAAAEDLNAVPPWQEPRGAIISIDSETQMLEGGPASPPDDAAETFIDGQLWENVQIQSVRRLRTPTDPSVADYVWLSGDVELNDLHPPTKVPTADGHSSPLIVRSSQSDLVKRPPARRGPFKTPALREQTSRTRQLKACVRCRKMRIRCVIDENDPTGECMTCKELQDPRIHTLPCARFKITECALYRTGKAPGLEFTSRWPKMKLRDITNWADSDIRDIEVLSDVCPVPLKCKVRRFVPMRGDSLKRGWMDGKVKKFAPTTPFAIVNMAHAVKDMKEYIDAHVFQCMETFTKGADELIQHTYQFAIKYAERHSDSEEGLFMANFFRLWFAIRRTHTLEHLSGDDTLDMRAEDHGKAYPWSGKVPLPPVMIQQLDMILTLGILRPLRKKYLEDLQRFVNTRASSAWMVVYLTIFMGSHGCAVTTAENYNSARKHGLRRRYAMPAFIAERHHAANVLLSHYHYSTQQYKTDPFHMDWKRRQATSFADLTTEDIHFLTRTKKLVEAKQERFGTNREQHLYEDELFWVSQLFETDWQPQDTHIDFDDGTINDVPLREYV